MKTFIVRVDNPTVRDTLANHGQVGDPQTLKKIIIFKTDLTQDEVADLPGVLEVEEESLDTPFDIDAYPYRMDGDTSEESVKQEREVQVQSRPRSWFLPSASNTQPDYTYTRTGRGIAIYIMDSGVRLDHRDFNGRHIETVFTYDGRDYGGDVRGAEHGTMCASCAAGNIYGIAKEASIFNARYNWTSSEGIKALDTILAHHRTHNMPSVLSMSFSSSSNIYDQALTELAHDGVVLVSSAGNYDESRPRFPAVRDDVIAVAACNENLYPSRWGGTTPGTNYGKEVDIWAGGSGGRAASMASTTSEQSAGGTSSACPLIAGTVALVLEDSPKLKSYADVLNAKDILIKNSRKGVIKYNDAKYNETPNRYIYTLIDDEMPEPLPVPKSKGGNMKKAALVIGAALILGIVIFGIL